MIGQVVRLVEAYNVPWWPNGSVKPAEVEYIGPWPTGGSGLCVRRFDADTVAKSNRLAQAFVKEAAHA